MRSDMRMIRTQFSAWTIDRTAVSWERGHLARIVEMNVSFRPRGWHCRGFLPHFDGGQIAQTITFRLADSLPNKILARWERELSH